jgi:hypothetical protein
MAIDLPQETCCNTVDFGQVPALRFENWLD